MKLTAGGTTRTSDPDDSHGHYLAGILHTGEQLVRHAEQIRLEMDSDRGVKLRGCRYVALSSALVTGGQRRVVSASACEWFGYFLTETGGVAPLQIQVGDGESQGDDPVAVIIVPAGTSVPVRWTSGIAMSRGLVLTPVSGAGVVSGSVFLR